MTVSSDTPRTWMDGWRRRLSGLDLGRWLVHLAALLPALWILAANSFMQEPVGYVLRNGRLEMNNFLDLLLNPTLATQFPHTVFAGFTTAAFFVMGVSAYHLLRKNEIDLFRRSFQIAAMIGAISIVLVVLNGHSQTQHLMETQPMKMASAEALYETESPASFVEAASRVEGLNFETVLPGGFGVASFSVTVGGWNAVRWYRDYLGYHCVLFDHLGRRLYEGYIDSTDADAGGVSVSLTGYYAQQIGMDPPKGRLPPWTRVLPHYLKPLGYRCYHSGKWHLTGAPKSVADGGFDHSYRFEDWDRYFTPAKHFENDVLLPPVEPGSGYYATTAFAVLYLMLFSGWLGRGMTISNNDAAAAPGNAGAILYMDIIMPLVAVLFYVGYKLKQSHEPR